MYFCYLDESGTPEDAGTSHYVLVGVAIPAEQWKSSDFQITSVKRKYGLEHAEIHTGWLLRRYLEQERIPGFAGLAREDRRAAVERERKGTLLHTAAVKPHALQSVQKNLRKTAAYIHLTMDERRQLVKEVADIVGGWNEARLFAEAIDKRHYTQTAPVLESAFEQVVTRFDAFLEHRAKWLNAQGRKNDACNLTGLLIEDNNTTANRKLTRLMRRFHSEGTLFRAIQRIIETPLFVDSELTSMVQVADICAYAIRRFLENNEEELLNTIYSRFDRARSRVVGLRHYTGSEACNCKICKDHTGNTTFLPG